MRALVCVLALSLGLAGCANPSSRTYETGDVGRTIETTRARVVSSRVVKIAGESDFKGPLAGGVIGAGATGLTVHGSGAGIAAILAGLVGAGAGYLAQQEFNNREGVEYILDMEDGRTVTLVQNREQDEQPLADGTPVLVQVSGQYTRVLADPRAETAAAGGAAGDWVDPDSLPAPAAGPEREADAGLGRDEEVGREVEVGAGRVPEDDFAVGRAPGRGEPVPLTPAPAPSETQ